MEAEIIAEKARKSIGKFCFNECKAYCCRKGYLVLGEEVDLVTQGRKKELEEKKILCRLSNNKYSLYMGDYDAPCPSMANYKCKIHRDPKRPDACKNFPLFIEGKTIRLSSRCLAVKEGLFYPYIARLLKLGYKLSDNAPYSDLEFDKMSISK